MALHCDRLLEMLKSGNVNLEPSALYLAKYKKEIHDRKLRGLHHGEKLDVGKLLTGLDEKSCLVVGEHGVGKTCLAASIIISWHLGDNEFENITKFQHIASITGNDIKHAMTHQSIILTAFSLSCACHDPDKILTYLSTTKVLIVVDDVDVLSEKSLSCLTKLKTEFKNISVLIFCRPYILQRLPCNYFEGYNVLQLHGFQQTAIIPYFTKLIGDIEYFANFTHTIKQNLIRLYRVLRFPAIIYETCELVRKERARLKNLFTSSELMWFILLTKAEMLVGKDKSKVFLLKWLQTVSVIAFTSLKAESRIEDKFYLEIEQETLKEFKQDNIGMFIEDIFQPRFLLSPVSSYSGKSSKNKAYVEYLAGFYVHDMLLKNKYTLHEIVPRFVLSESFVLFTAGHMKRSAADKKFKNEQENKIVQVLAKYRENSYDDLYFIYKLVAEVRCLKKLVELIVDATEYPEEWNLPVENIQLKPLVALLEYVAPIRLILLEEEQKANHELESVLEYVSRINISLWLDSLPQFDYGNNTCMDSKLKPLLQKRVYARVDLLSGFVSSSMLNEITTANSTKYLVMLRLRITNESDLYSVLKVHTFLPNLLWLELKLDLEIKDLELYDIPQTNVALMDIHIRHVDDSSVALLSDLLAQMHHLYSGLHLEQTELTPEGVFTLLLELTKRDVKLRAEPEAIDKFRKWYYPQLTAAPKDTILSNEEVIEMIKHDDRNFYSDHEVYSSKFVSALNSWNLTSYLEEKEEIVHFMYKASNVKFTKEFDGTVSTTQID